MGVHTTIDPVTGDQIAQDPEISDTELDMYGGLDR